jgi:hypothetical protein
MRYLRAVLAAAFMVLCGGSAGHASTVNYSLNTVISCCGAGPFGTVTVTDTGAGPFGTVTVTDISGGIQIDAQLNQGYLFVHGGQDASFGFTLNGISSVSFQNLTSSWTAVSSNAGNLHLDGAGNFGYGIVAPGTNASQASASSVSFQVLASNLSIENLIASTGGGVTAIFAADIGQCADGTCASNNFTNNGTGFVATTGPMATPLPGTLSLLLSGLAGLAALFRGKTRAQGRRSAQLAPA